MMKRKFIIVLTVLLLIGFGVGAMMVYDHYRNDSEIEENMPAEPGEGEEELPTPEL